jgi:multiple sugar transport system ATP-binding protein
MASVRFEQVSKQYANGYTALKDFNLTIDDGEFLVLVGPSGCGKTTSLRLLAGLEAISDGNLYINEQPVNTLSAKDRDIAMVFQSYALYPHMSVFENMAFSLQLKGLPKTEIAQRVQKAAQQLDIEPLLTRKPKQLSGGQRQRVAVGRAIVRNPAVFLMDEPLSNLDAKLRGQARYELSQLHQSLGTTFVYVTHDQAEAMTMGTRIAVMNRGILQQVDTPQQIYDAPQNVFVAGFLGSPPMNFWPAQLRTDAPDSWAIEIAAHEGAQPIRLALPPSRYERYATHRDQPMIFGIRPESIFHPDYVAPGILPAVVTAEATLVEHMGHESIGYFRIGREHSFSARLDPRVTVRVGEAVDLRFDMNRFYLFDAETEQVL